MILAPLAAMLVQMAISRTREFSADRLGAEICGQPLWLASALQKIEQLARDLCQPTAERNPATAHLFIVNPLRRAASTGSGPTRRPRTGSGACRSWRVPPRPAAAAAPGAERRPLPSPFRENCNERADRDRKARALSQPELQLESVQQTHYPQICELPAGALADAARRLQGVARQAPTACRQRRELRG